MTQELILRGGGNIEHAYLALAGVGRWTECQPVNPKVRFPVQAHACLQARSPGGGVQEATNRDIWHIAVSLSLTLPSFLSLKVKK